ncbi:MAG: enoyl-CoA hydratase/isomerase family protein [Deltaproteobacteria bacterium]|nr:enoyl-CoA hydratase/isomerase family protein [Deltaproteobacteria bacterium]MBW2359761.1 enoyl-CoA hydratase/isomerase family protein [Deltaproteobacteria bacterium]
MSLSAGLPDVDHLRCQEIDDDIVLMTLARPERLNALSQALIADLHAAFEALGSQRTLRAILLTGEGRGFCAGADVKGNPGENGAPGSEGMGKVANTFVAQEHLAALHERIHRCPKPVIAAVNGACMGGGFSMALACDIRFAATSATFGARFIKMGVSACDMGTSYFLPRLVGASRSAELLLTGRIFDAAEAREMSLVLDVVPDGQVVARSLETARQIRENPPLATWMTKETMWQTLDAPSLRHALDMENRTQVMCTATGELEEAFAAFSGKRPPRWQGL